VVASWRPTKEGRENTGSFLCKTCAGGSGGAGRIFPLEKAPPHAEPLWPKGKVGRCRKVQWGGKRGIPFFGEDWAPEGVEREAAGIGRAGQKRGGDSLDTTRQEGKHAALSKKGLQEKKS